jgi:hypothetical protein
MVSRGHDHERLAGAASVADDKASIQALDAEIAKLEAARDALLRDGLPDERTPEPRDYSHSHFSGGSADRSVER